MQALAWAESRADAGYDDWRLPDAKELQSIVDYTQAPLVTGTAACDTIFHCSVIVDEGGGADFPFYWTSTSHRNWMNQARGAVHVAFGTGYGFMETPPGSGNYELLDVHGAGCQRSDPKTGDPADYPHGLGPQGDVIRIFNNVRPVRLASSTSSVVDDPHAADDVPVATRVMVRAPPCVGGVLCRGSNRDSASGDASDARAMKSTQQTLALERQSSFVRDGSKGTSRRIAPLF